MFRFIFRACIIGVVGFLAFAVVRPFAADTLMQSVVGNLITKDAITVTSPAPALLDKAEKLTTNIPTTHDVTALTIDNIIDATNAERITAGLLPLKVNAKLLASAKIKVDDMIAKQYFEHVSPEGVGVSDLGKRVGYDYVVMGENLALGDFSSTADLVDAWMKSPGHRANILNTNYQDIGVSIVRAEYQHRQVWFAVQHFGTERGVCPKIDQSLKSAIVIFNADLKKREGEIAALQTQLESPDRPKGALYNEMVARFNQMITDYNSVLVNSQRTVAEYNVQVNVFNTCLSQYQAR